jgi:hypothetical protein
MSAARLPAGAGNGVRSTEVSECAAPGRFKQARTAVRSTEVVQ